MKVACELFVADKNEDKNEEKKKDTIIRKEDTIKYVWLYCTGYVFVCTRVKIHQKQKIKMIPINF